MYKFGVTGKIWLSCAVFIGGYAIATFLGQLQSHSQESRLGRTAAALFPAAQKMQSAEAAFERMIKLYRDAVMTEDGGPLDQAKEESAHIVEGLRAVSALPGLSSDLARPVSELAAAISALGADADSTYRRIAASKGNMDSLLQASLKDLSGRIEKASESLAVLVRKSAEDLHGEVEAAAKESARQRWISLIVFLLTLTVSAAVVNLTIRRAILNPLGTVTAQLSTSAQFVASAASELSEVSHTLARSSSDQAAQLQETASSGDEANAAARKNAESADAARTLMRDSVKNFAGIDDAHNQLLNAMNEISLSSGRISKIISVIDNIAFQTNILALNAAVEAARAGEFGAGFAVVADEVRSLAMRSAKAAGDTTALIEESVSCSKTGRQRVDTITALLDANREIAGKVSAIIEQISTSTQAQATDISRISDSVTTTSRTTQITSEHAQQSATVVKELTHQSLTLNEVVESLQLMIGR